MTQKLTPIHPGEILKEEFLDPLGLSIRAFAESIRVPPNRVSRLVAGQSRVTADTALRLAKALDTSPELWMTLQSRYALQCAEDAGVVPDDIASVVAA